MSHRNLGAGRKTGLTRSSSSSSSSSSSTSSSSSSCRRNRRTDRSRSQSSSASSRSRSRTRSRERYHKRQPNRGDRNEETDRSDARIASRSKQQLEPQHEDSSSDHLIDDSIRSDKSSKSSSSNGRSGETAESQRDTVPSSATAAAATTAAKTTTIKVPKPAPRISKTAIQFGKPGTVARPGIHMKLSQTKPQPEQPKKITVASAFNNDSDDEVEEMPPECKMRMRNIGRDTPTSSGPNSFGKTKQGFIDSKKLFEKSLREAAME